MRTEEPGEGDAVAAAEVDHRVAPDIVRRCLHVRKAREPERRQIELVGARDEVADAVLSGAVVEHELVGAGAFRQGIATDAAIDGVITSVSDDLVAEKLAQRRQREDSLHDLDLRVTRLEAVQAANQYSGVVPTVLRKSA